MTRPLLVEQHEALSDFLDDLLSEEVPGPEEAPSVSTTSQADVPEVSEPPQVSEQQPVMAQQVSETAIVGSSAPAVILPDFSTYDRVPVIPDWGLQAFQVMVFKVGELSLAVPLVELAGVLEWPVSLQSTDKSHEMCLGTYRHEGQDIRVVDTARLVFSERDYQGLYLAGSSPRNTRIILINKGKLGLACDSVQEVINVQPTRIKWRSTQTRRQWLAGTMLEEMLAILDTRSATIIITEILGMSE